MPTVGLLRTNPKLTSNAKIVVDTDDQVYLDVIATDSLSHNRFSRIKVNPSNQLAYDLYKFFGKGTVPSSIIYETARVSSDLDIVTTPDYQFEHQYNYGAAKLPTAFYQGSNSIFAPLLIDKELPRYFVIFQVEGAKALAFERNPSILIPNVTYLFQGSAGSILSYDNQSYPIGSTFKVSQDGGSNYQISGNGWIQISDPDYEFQHSLSSDTIRKQFISDSKIVKVFDLYNSNIGKYVLSHIGDTKYTSNPINIDFIKKEISYTGINLKNGIVSTITERMNGIIEKELSIIDFDEYITQGFERNNLLSPNILNLEYCFDTNSEGKINRYFGLYVDTLDLCEFKPDMSLMFARNNFSNPYFRNYQSTVPTVYNSRVTVPNGFTVVPESIRSGFIPLNLSTKDSFYYIKNKFGDLFKVNNSLSTDNIRLTDNTVESSEFMGFNESIAIPSTFSTTKGQSTCKIRFTDYHVQTGFRISVHFRGIYKGHIYGDHLPTLEPEFLPYGEGDNYSFYFYPYGQPESIAKAAAKAFNSKFKGILHLKAKSDGDEMIIYSGISGKGMDDYSIFIENLVTHESWNLKFGGGSDTAKNRIIVPIDLDQRITENTRILTDKGYTKIRSIATCLEDSNNKKVITSVDDNAEILIQHGYAQFYNESTLKFGVLHIYELADFDYDFHESSYSKSYYNEYLKYFAVKKLEPGRTYKLFGFGELNASIRYSPDGMFSFILNSKDNNIAYQNFVHKINPSTFQIYVGGEGYILDYNTLNFIRVSDNAIIYYNDVAFEQNQGMLLYGYDVEWDFTDTNGNSYTFVFTPDLVNTEFNPGGIMSDFSYFTSNGIGPAFYDISFQRLVSGRPCYFVLFANTLYPSLPLMGWLPFDTATDTIYQPDITFTTTNRTEYEILGGDPYFIETKYLGDDELKKFTGFNSMTFRNRYLDVSDPDKVENKIKIFDKESAVTEYDKLYENIASQNILKSRIVPTINKWIINGKNIREDEYRLNLSHIFGELNFSPSFVDDTQNPYYFTHEWLYLIGIPDGITIDDLKKSDSYFSRPFDERKLADLTDDYFTKYFTIDEHVIKNDSGIYQSVAVPHQVKYSVFERISNTKFITFFRGVRIELGSDGIDYSGYKFSAVLNIKKTNQLIYEDPFSINIIRNDKYKNVTYVVNITIDDYKIINGGGEIRPDFLYLYIMNSLKYYNTQLNAYGYGIDFNYPTVPGLTLRRNGAVTTGFKGYRLPIKTDFNGLSNPDYLKFAKKYKVVDYLLPVNGNLNRIIGIDQAGTILITSDNAFVSTGIYDVDKPTTTLRVINDELILRPYGITMVNIPSLSVYGNLNPFGVNFGVYDLTYVNWYHEGGGQDVYKIIAKLISFASLFKLTNEQNELVNYKQAVNGGLQNMNSKISLQFAKPNSVDKYSIITVNEIKKQVPKITDSIVTDYQQVQTAIDPKTYYRYSGDYKPKLKKILWFKTDKLELMWSNVGKKWSDMNFKWTDLHFDIVYNDSNIDNIDLPYSFVLRGYNTLFDFSIEKFGMISNLYYHKSSDNKILKLDQPIYKSVDEIAIDRKQQSIFSSDWDAKYYRKYLTKNQYIEIDGYQSLMDTKSFLGSHIFSIKKDFILNVDPSKIVNGAITPDIDMGTNHIIWNKVDKQYTFKISGKNMFIDYMVANYYNEFITYFKDSSIDTFKKYVEVNILKTVSIDATTVYTKFNGSDLGTFNFDTDELLLLKQGYMLNRAFKNSFDLDQLTLNLTYNQQFDGFPVFNIRLKVTT